MNVKEAANKWKVSESTVRRWSRGAWIDSAKFDLAKRVWEIADDAIRPYIFSDKKQNTHLQRLALILSALSLRRTIPLSKMHCDRSEMKEHFDELHSAGLIKKKNIDNEDLFLSYVPTIKGDEFLEKSKGLKKIADDLSPLIEAVTAGSVKGVLDHSRLY